MSYEGFYGGESSGVWFYPGWRCIHCGALVDQVIALNRRLNQSALRQEQIDEDDDDTVSPRRFAAASKSHLDDDDDF